MACPAGQNRQDSKVEKGEYMVSMGKKLTGLRAPRAICQPGDLALIREFTIGDSEKPRARLAISFPCRCRHHLEY